MIGDGLLKAALMAQARAEGLDNVVWLDPVPKERLPGILKACDLGLMTLENVPLFNTVCPNKFMDYLASGLPVLVNFGGEVADFCREESCGVVVPPEDPKGMAQAIAELAADPARSREMGRRGQALAARQFDRRLLVEQLESVLAAAVAERRAGG
jgi:glycosyltransferase involved in cell wall biosynthesis